MAITINAQNYGADSASTSVTIPLTIAAGTDTMLHCVVKFWGNGSVTGVTWNGSAMTLGSPRTIAGGTHKVYHAYMAAPATGSHNVVVSLSSAEASWTAAVAADGVEQSSHIRGYAEFYDTFSSPKDYIPSGALDGDLLITVQQDVGTSTSGWAANTGSTFIGTQSAWGQAARRIATADGQGAGFSWSGGSLFASAAAVALKPSAGGSSTGAARHYYSQL